MATPGISEMQQMAMEMNRLQQNTRKVLDLFVATLIEKHGGRVFVKYDTMDAIMPQSMGVLVEDMGPALKTLRVTLCDRFNKPCTAMGDGIPEPEPDIPQQSSLAVPSSVTEPEPENIPSPACEGVWHKDAAALGRRCPDCGSADRVS